MSKNVTIPYITLSDLDKVLAVASCEGLITPEAAQDLYERSEQQMQFQIRKAQAQKDINVLRDKCSKVCASIYKASQRFLDNQIRILAVEHNKNYKLAVLEHDSNCRAITVEHLDLINKSQSTLDEIKQIEHTPNLTSEEILRMSEARSLAMENIRETKSLKQERMIDENDRHHMAISKLKQTYAHKMLEISEKQRDSLLEREETKNRIRDAKPEELPALLESLQSDLDRYLKGGDK